MNRPLLLAFILFISGIVFAHYVSIPFLSAISLIAVLFISIVFLRKKKARAFYGISGLIIFMLGIVCYINFNRLPQDHISRLLGGRPKQYFIEGVIISSPEYSWPNPYKRKATFLIEAMGYREDGPWIRLSGLSRVNIRDNEIDYSYGDQIVILGRLKAPKPSKAGARFDYAEYLRRRGIYAIIDVPSDDNVALLKGRYPFPVKRSIHNIRRAIEKLIKRYLPSQDGALLNAMLIGKRGDIPTKLKELFIRTGTAHILSISGLHVGIVSAIIFFIFQFMGLPRKISCLLIIWFLIIYAIIAGERTPIIRSVIMINTCLVGYILEREFDIYSALSLAAIIILIINPMQAFSAGFILSFASVFSICYLTPKLEKPFRLSEKSRPARYILRLLLASIAVYIGIMPLIAYYFNIISPVTILANMIVVPTLGVILFVGILLIIFGGILAPVAGLLAYFLHILFIIFIKAVEYLSKIPFSYFYLSAYPAYLVAAYYGLLLLLIFALSRRERPSAA